jgi:hypothetical protein
MIKVFIDGFWSKEKPSYASQSLILTLIEKAHNLPVKVVEDLKSSDLIILYPFLSKVQRNRLRVMNKLSKFTKIKPSFSLLMGYPHDNIIAISHENLDSPDWAWFKTILLTYKLKRLTFWPKEIDPDGCRFPYWWNYVQHDDIELDPSCYSLYGKPLSLQKLMSPFEPNNAAKDKIALLQRHLRYPRNNQVKSLETFKPVDIYMPPHNSWHGTKHELLSTYKYNFCAENSCGYGYETEKLPEAWDAGCIPLGYIQNPLSQFSSEIFFDSKIDIEKIIDFPLIKHKPDLSILINYIKKMSKL